MLKRLFHLRRPRRGGSDADRDGSSPKDVERRRAEDTGSWGYLDARNAGREFGVTAEKYGRPR